jgi:putative transposase
VSRYQFIRDHRSRWPVVLMAEVLEVSTSGYFEWLGRAPSARRRRREELAVQVRDVFEASHRNYGSRKVAHELARRRVNCCRNTVAKIMRASNLHSRAQKRRRFVVTTDSNHGYHIPENRLDRRFHAERPNQKWVADITFVPTQEGFAYLAAVMDLYSRRIVGWAVSDSIDTDLVFEALKQAIETRRPGAGLLHHSDRGCQYASDRYRKMLQRHGIECSMSRRGDCWDNAAMERFMNSFKNEWANHHDYGCVEDVRPSVFKFIEIYYNRERRHQTLGYLSPAEFEMTDQTTSNAA